MDLLVPPSLGPKKDTSPGIVGQETGKERVGVQGRFVLHAGRLVLHPAPGEPQDADVSRPSIDDETDVVFLVDEIRNLREADGGLDVVVVADSSHVQEPLRPVLFTPLVEILDSGHRYFINE